MNCWKIVQGVCLGVLISGCTAHKLSGLESDFERLQTTRSECAAQEIGKDNADLCAANSDASMLDIARQARQEADSASDPRTQIAFLRLAATAGWQSGSPEGLDIADEVALSGSDRCDKLPADTFGAPRDCALIRLSAPFARHVRAVNFLTSLPGNGPLSNEQRNELKEQSQTYVANTWDAMETIRAGLAADPSISPTLIAYLNRQRKIVFCTTKELAGRDSGAGDFAMSNELTSAMSTKMISADSELAPEKCPGWRPE